MKTASWVIIENNSRKAIFETFSKEVANNINTKKYSAIPILEYLCELNRQTKQNNSL
jgi:hypothetical protein